MSHPKRLTDVRVELPFWMKGLRNDEHMKTAVTLWLTIKDWRAVDVIYGRPGSQRININFMSYERVGLRMSDDYKDEVLKEINDIYDELQDARMNDELMAARFATDDHFATW